MRGLNTAMKANILGAILALVMPLITKLIDMAMQSKTVQAVMQAAFKVIGQVVGTVMKGASVAINWLIDAGKSVVNWLKANWPLLVAILTGPVGIAVLAIVKHWDRIKEAVGTVRDWIVDKWNAVVDFLRGFPGRSGASSPNCRADSWAWVATSSWGSSTASRTRPRLFSTR